MSEVPFFSAFPPEVHAELGYYVYRLVDPRSGQTFYVGKGRGNRVFDHVNRTIQTVSDDEQAEDAQSLKMKTIQEIGAAGLQVQHIIHRHGLSEEVALEVEAAVIDAYPGLANVVGGHGCSQQGTAHAAELVQRYGLEAVPSDDELTYIAINVSRSMQAGLTPYAAARYAWKIAEWRRSTPTVVLSHVAGVINGVFDVVEWLPATDAVFASFHKVYGDDSMSGRYGFVGHQADQAVHNRYYRKRLPSAKPGEAWPLRYFGPGWKQ